MKDPKKKKYWCDKKFNKYSFKPDGDSFPVCHTCPPMRDLINDKSVKINGNNVFCLSGQVLNPWQANGIQAYCQCNKKTGNCAYIDSKKRDVTTQLQTAKCIDVATMESTGPRLPSGLTCSREDGTRIVGGQDAEPNTWPWMVQLEYGTAFNCGGVIVGENLVLTGNYF